MGINSRTAGRKRSITFELGGDETLANFATSKNGSV